MQTETRRLLLPEDLRRPFRHATRRNPDLRTRGGKIAVLAGQGLGRPLLPHQQYIADVATELNPPGSRLTFRRQLVIINEPRQVGKTTLWRPVSVERCLAAPSTAVYMTAQSGKWAGRRWEDLVEDLEVPGSPLARFVDVKRGKGDQRCAFPNASKISPFPPVEDGLHGETPPLVGIDEAWAFTLEQGRNLMRAITPAQITRRDRQTWIMSAAGTAESEWWDELVELGRASVDDPDSPIAYFEHSMTPGADPYDPASWEFHPGLDGLITLEDLAAEADPKKNTHADFLRGFMNVPTKVRDVTVIDLAAWNDRGGELSEPDAEQIAYAYDVAIDRSSASVWQAWRDTGGRLNVAVLETRPGADWLPEFAGNLQATGAHVAADDGGPARPVTDALTRAGRTIHALNGKDASTAWTSFKAAVRDEQLVHDGSPALAGAIEVAVERYVGDAKLLSRRHSLGPIDPLMAANVAAWNADRLVSTSQMW